MKEEIIDVVNPVKQGKASLYVLVPEKVRERLAVTEKTEFIVILVGDDIIYRKKETPKHG